MKYIRYVTVAIFTFAVGVGISPIRFYSEMIACGPNNSTTTYRSSYFIQTWAGYAGYDSEAAASDAFNERLSKAILVYDRTPKTNNKGMLIEQRAVAQFYSPNTGEYYVEVFWRDRDVVHRIHSRSYMHVIDFEKHDYEY
jgi:hypothetical protein